MSTFFNVVTRLVRHTHAFWILPALIIWMLVFHSMHVTAGFKIICCFASKGPCGRCKNPFRDVNFHIIHDSLRLQLILSFCCICICCKHSVIFHECRCNDASCFDFFFCNSLCISHLVDWQIWLSLVFWCTSWILWKYSARDCNVSLLSLFPLWMYYAWLLLLKLIKAIQLVGLPLGPKCCPLGAFLWYTEAPVNDKDDSFASSWVPCGKYDYHPEPDRYTYDPATYSHWAFWSKRDQLLVQN